MISNPVLTQNKAKCNLHQNHPFGSRFRQTVITNPFLSQNDAKRNVMEKNVVLALDLEKL